ncbi:MAG TPA: hypothetical protein GX501_01210 [Clostridiaceae bacterium]|nr:hypothetical protein [Clostridiaceae bacterium]
MKRIKDYIWFILIIAQIITGTAAGMLLLSGSEAGPEIVNTSVGGVPLDGLTPVEAAEKLLEYYREKTGNGKIVIEIDGNPFTIPYTDIDVRVDIESTRKALEEKLPGNELEKLFYGTGKTVDLIPAFTYNSGKLQKILKELLSHYEKEPTAESYEIRNGALVVIPGESGIRVDYQYLEDRIKELIFSSDEQLKISSGSSEAFVSIPAVSEFNEPFSVIVSTGRVKLDTGLAPAAQDRSKALQGLVVENGQEFSLKSVLDFSVFKGDVEKDLLNRMATALYQAALPLDGIRIVSRLPSKMPVSYTEPGFEAVIEGENADLTLKNETGKALMLFAETTDDAFIVYLVSSGELKKGTLSSEKKDEVQPSVITIVNKSLGKDETRVVSEGVPGFTVYVYRTIDGVTEELYRDKYQPISRTVETGEKPSTPDSK